MKLMLPPNFSLEKYNTFVRLVNENDAEFIVKLRGDEKKSRFISKTDPDVNLQVQWIRNYKVRELKGQEYYFIVCDTAHQPFGTTRIYHFDNDCFETGSWVFKENSPTHLPVVGDIIGREIGFDFIGFETCKFEVRKGNTKVLKYHALFNPEIKMEDELNYYFELKKEIFNVRKNKLLKLYGYGTE